MRAGNCVSLISAKHHQLFTVSLFPQHLIRTFASHNMANSPKSIVLGVYNSLEYKEPNNGAAGGGKIIGTPAFHHYDSQIGNRLSRVLASTGYFQKKIKCGTVRVISDELKLDNIVVVGLGPRDATVDNLEQRDEFRENVRIAAGAAARCLRELCCPTAVMDTFGDDEAAAEGSHLQLFSYDELKAPEKRKVPIALFPLPPDLTALDFTNIRRLGSQKWSKGVIAADGQNYCRKLMEIPANLKLAPMLAEMVAADLMRDSTLKISVEIRDEKWINSKKMGSFLSVSRGSAAPPRLLEIAYRGAEGAPIAVVGKGITFDTGGISLKPSLNMDLMQGDMGGAACVVASILTAARQKLPVNLLGIVPICENMPGGRATRPGDVVTAMNGKTIQVDNTDAEGRLILADALCYAQEFQPKFVLDLATLTGAMRVALGGGAAGCFTNDLSAWELMRQASITTGDRVWQMPLFKLFADQMTDCHLADLNNVGKYAGAGSCTAAGFLREFILKDTKWMHMDIAGVSENKDEMSYLGKGFSGRPVRTLVEFYQLLVQKDSSRILPVSKSI